MALTRYGRKVTKFVIEAQRAAMETRRKQMDRKKLVAASNIAASLRVPRERFFEAIKEEGLEYTLQQLSAIKKISLALNLRKEEIAKMLERNSINAVFGHLMQEYEQAQEAGMVA